LFSIKAYSPPQTQQSKHNQQPATRMTTAPAMTFKAPAMTFTVSDEMTATEFKNKHGGYPIGVFSSTRVHLAQITRGWTEELQKTYPQMSLEAINRSETTIFLLLRGASSLQYEQFHKRSGEALMTFSNGYKIFNFISLTGWHIRKMDKKISPPEYTENPPQEQPQQEAKDALASAWKEIEAARKKIEEERKQIEAEKIKMTLRAKMSLFDEEIAKFKQQFFTQEELVSIRKTFDPLY